MRNSREHQRQQDEVTRRRLDALAAVAEQRPVAAAAVPSGAPSEPSDVAEEPRSAARGRHARRPVSPTARLLGLVADRLPATVRGRAHLGAAQLGLVALVVAVGLAVTTWWMVRATGPHEALAPPRPVAAPASSGVPVEASGDATATGTAPAEETVVVDVAGRVRRPGIAVLPVGARVVDALEAAGGVKRGVDLTTLNLARLLVDGEQVVVGAVGSSGASSATTTGPAATPLVSINTADLATLETLPGVGPVTAAAIVAWRDEHGAFSAVEELLEVSGIGPATLEQLLPHVTL